MVCKYSPERMIVMQNTKKLCMGCMSENESGSVCAVCGFDEASYESSGLLPLRFKLANRFLVGKLISSNGEGNTYLGYDTEGEMVVKIREYFPMGIAARNEEYGASVEKEKSFIYNEGLLKFIELYKKLGTLGVNNSFFKVINIFESGNTAYVVCEYLPGITLKEFLIRNGGILKWEQVRPLFLPLITAIKEFHDLGIVHGGISPETLIVGRDGKIRITDFAIPEVRTANSNMTAHLFPGFAALEQYEENEITPATDVYSFAATIFRTLTGNPPADATSRLERDNLVFSKAIAEELPRGVLVALANALKLRAENRTSDIETFKNDINSSSVKLSEETQEPASNNKKNNSSKRYTMIAAIVTTAILLVLGTVIYFVALKGSDNDTAKSSTLSLPSVVSVGDVGNSKKPDALFSVPDFTNKTYAEIMENEEYTKWFVFDVVKKEYNSEVAKGKICGQSLAVGTSAKRDSKIELTVSLGPKEIVLPKQLLNMPKEKAYIKLLELGFEAENIEFMGKMGNTATEEEVIIEALPAIGSKVSPDDSVILYYNSNIIEEESSDISDSDANDDSESSSSAASSQSVQ